MRIVVVGASGLIGSRLVRRLRQVGHEPVAASRSSGVDAATGTGLDEAMKAAQVVIDVTNPPASGGVGAEDFFLRAGNHISAAANAASVRHRLVLSVVGADRLVESDYFRAKVLQEELARQSGIPYTIIRSTQFFEFLQPIADFSAEGRIVRLPTALVQTVAADDVADALTSAALQPPANDTIELAGPESFPLNEAVARVLAVSDDDRAVIGDPDALYFGTHLSERALMPGDRARVAPTDIDTWLSRTRAAA